MSVRFVNTTTRLPADADIEAAFERIAEPKFAAMCGESHHPRDRGRPFDIFLVGSGDLERNRAAAERGPGDPQEREREPERQREPIPDDEAGEVPDTDVLGCYFPHHPDMHRPVILLSPEKILQASVTVHARITPTLPLRVIYPALFCAVAIHELAHALMDGESSHHMHHRTSLRWLTNCFDGEHRNSFYVPSDHDGQSCIDCKIREINLGDRRIILPRVRRIEHIVEESLANAFALRQRFSDEERIAVTAFVRGQSPAYRAGLNWTMDEKSLWQSAQSWSGFKHLLPGGRRGYDRWKRVYEEHRVQTPLDLLADRLLQEAVPNPVDFQAEFRGHLVERLPDWQTEYERMGRRGIHEQRDDFLNDGVGVYWWVTSFGGLGDEGQRLEWLRLWAGNGSAEGFDRYQQALSARHVDQGEFEQALACQQARRTKVVARAPEYHRDRELGEIDQAIARIEALRAAPPPSVDEPKPCQPPDSDPAGAATVPQPPHAAKPTPRRRQAPPAE